MRFISVRTVLLVAALALACYVALAFYIAARSSYRFYPSATTFLDQTNVYVVPPRPANPPKADVVKVLPKGYGVHILQRKVHGGGWDYAAFVMPGRDDRYVMNGFIEDSQLKPAP